MNRDDATKIARRILDRVEQDRALHLDSLVEEIMAGFALYEPIVTQVFQSSDTWAEPFKQAERNLERELEMQKAQYAAERANAQRTEALDARIKAMYGMSPAASIFGDTNKAIERAPSPLSGDQNPLRKISSTPPGAWTVSVGGLTLRTDVSGGPPIAHSTSTAISADRADVAGWTYDQMRAAGWRLNHTGSLAHAHSYWAPNLTAMELPKIDG